MDDEAQGNRKLRVAEGCACRWTNIPDVLVRNGFISIGSGFDVNDSLVPGAAGSDPCKILKLEGNGNCEHTVKCRGTIRIPLNHIMLDPKVLVTCIAAEKSSSVGELQQNYKNSLKREMNKK
jgi:hypothetical protein